MAGEMSEVERSRSPSLVSTVLLWLAVMPVTLAAALLVIIVRPLSGGPGPGLRIASTWARVCLWIAGCKMCVNGRPEVVDGRAFVIMANHCSALDILALLASVPVALGIVFWAKHPLFKVPLLGQAMRALDFLPVDRVERSKAVPMFGESLELIRLGRSPVVFPEETYGRADEMLPFQRGGFLLAIRSGLAVLPVGIAGTARAMPPGSRTVRPTRVVVSFGEPIVAEINAVSARRGLQARVREQIESLSRQSPSG